MTWALITYLSWNWLYYIQYSKKRKKKKRTACIFKQTFKKREEKLSYHLEIATTEIHCNTLYLTKNKWLAGCIWHVPWSQSKDLLLSSLFNYVSIVLVYFEKWRNIISLTPGTSKLHHSSKSGRERKNILKYYLQFDSINFDD